MDKSLSDKFIDYPASPNKIAYIGIAKKPLMSTVTGIGFRGVLVQDKTRSKVQCSECGAWMRILSSLHLRKCSGMTSVEYREKHGLNKGNGLCSDVTSLKYTENALKADPTTRNAHLFKRGNLMKSSWKRTTERENGHGTCPEQIKDRLMQFIADNRELPSQGNKGRPLYKILVRRFGTFGQGLAHYGLPALRRRGTNVFFIFPDGFEYSFNINQFHDREALYTLMTQKCACLKPYLHKNED